VEAYLAQITKDEQDLKTSVEAIAHVPPKSTFLRNVGMESK